MLNTFARFIKLQVIFIFGFFVLLVVLIGLLVWKWDAIFGANTSSTVSVTGYAMEQQGNQIATMNVYVGSLNADKAVAVQEMNENAADIVEAIKEFGIPANDIKTVNQSIYQEQNWNPTTNQSTYGDWRASVGVEIRIKDLSQSSGLSSLLSTANITSLDGPYFSLDPQSAKSDTELLTKALEDARAKAEAIAAASGRRLGRLVSFQESDSYGYIEPYYRDSVGGFGGTTDSEKFIEPGTSNNSKTVHAVYELR